MIPDPGGRGQGRRDNGLTATSFASVGDIDPRVGEYLLDVLALDGIAAYLQPTIDHDSVTRAVSLPAHPTDRLFVDRHRAAEARALVAAEAEAAGRTGKPWEPSEPLEPEQPDKLDEEAEWAALVASFDRPSASVVPPWPVNEDTEVDVGPTAEEPRQAQEHDEPLEDEPAEDDEEGYVPPPPPPLPRISRPTAGALLTIAGGVFLLVLGSPLLSLDSDIAFRLGIVAIIAGVAWLIWRMRDDSDDADRPDDGAVV
ncbi:MAG: DUF308 domain-containing protein [Actinomycetota bacterium]|nr:DUF308 domain-containing protein [Actinomycetota bacterium]